MVKPILTPISTLPPLDLQGYDHYLPTAFNESLTILQKLNKMLVYLNEVHGLSSEIVTKWNEVMDWVMNDGLNDTVIAELDKMLTEGTFDDFFNEAIEELKLLRGTSFNGNIDFKKIHYRVDTDHTSVWLTDVPYLNVDGTRNVLKRGFAGDSIGGGMTETARNFSDRHQASAVFNASTFNMTSNVIDGAVVSNGISVKSDNSGYNWKWYLGIDANGIIKPYANGTSNEFMIGEGMKEVLTAFYPVIVNGAKVARSVWEAQGSTSPFDPYIRQVIAQRNNNDYVLLTSSGQLKPDQEKGLGMDDIYTILTDNYSDIKTAYVLDGGGSVQSVVYGAMINRPSDGSQTTERLVPDFLYFGKEMLSNRDHDIYNAYKTMGYIRKELANTESKAYYNTDNHSGYMRLLAPEGFISQGIESWDGENRNGKLLFNQSEIYYYDYINSKYIMRFKDGDIYTEKGRIGYFFDDAIPMATLPTNDLNTLTRSGTYWATIATTNNPFPSGSCEIKHTNVSSETAIQTATEFASPFGVLQRRKASGVWSAWA